MNSKTRFLVTGASGFIGSKMCNAILEMDCEVVALSRNSGAIQKASEIVSWSLGDDLPKKITADVAIHLAHDFDGQDGARRTIDGTLALVRKLDARGAKRQIFVSSYSSGSHAKSIYGKAKAAIEAAVSQQENMTIVRPGLVLGDSGIYARMTRLIIQGFPFIPLPDGGHGKVPTIEVDRLCHELLDLSLRHDAPKEANLFYPELTTLRALLTKVAKKHGKRPIFVSVPTLLALPALRCIEALGFKPPITSDSLIGFVRNQQAKHISTLKE